MGESVAVAWKNEANTACGGTEGFVLGVVGDELSGECIVLDRSTYQDSFKSEISALGILDLRVIPMKHVERIQRTELRRRPLGISEDFNMLMEVDYRSNIDFDATILKVEARSDCKPKRAGNFQSETYQLVIKEIGSLGGVSVVISCKRTIQIFCKHKDLDRCIGWIQEAVELLPDHKCLVLVPTKITYQIDDTYKEDARPTDEVIDRIAKAEGGSPVVFPIGWAHRFFVESDANPLQGLFYTDEPIGNLVFENRRKENSVALPQHEPTRKGLGQAGDLGSPRSGVRVTKYLGADAPLMRLTGLIKCPKDEEDLMQMWWASRSDPWQWFDNGQTHGKMMIRDLTIDKKASTYTVELRKYSGNEF